MSVFIGVLVVMVFLMLELIIVGMIAAIKYKKKKLNPIDICIFELTKNGVHVRNEIGRKQLDPHKGFRYVSAGFWPSSVKESLGYEIKDEHLYFSKKGAGRKYLLVALKDNVYSPLKYALKTKHLNLSKEEKELVNKLIERQILPFEGIENLETLSLTPIQYDAARFVLDTAGDSRDVYGDKNAELARTLLKWVVISIVILCILVIVVLVLFFTLGPDFFSARAAQTVSEVVPPQPMPGVNIPI